MRKRWGGALALGLGVAALALTPGVASATATQSGQATNTLTATLTAGASGTRTIASATPGALSSALGSAGESTSLTVTVTEAAVTGDAGGWYVTGQASDFTDTSSDTIPASDLVDGANAVTQTLGGGTTSAPPSPGGLGTAVTLFSNTGQNGSMLYTGTYADSSTLTLTPPNKTATGIYTSTLTVTLFT